jgi:signal transduction histidine kinase
MFCYKNLPNKESTYQLIGFISAISAMANAFLVSIVLQYHPSSLRILVLLPTIAWTISSYFIIFPILPECFKKHKIVPFLWLFGILVSLICIPFAFLILSNFAVIQFIIFAANIFAVLFIFSWFASLVMITIGIAFSVFFFQDYLLIDQNFEVHMSLAFVLFSTILVAFVKPKQKFYEVQEKLCAKLDDENKDMSKEINNLLIMKQEFLNNLSHEIRTPIHHIGAGAEALYKDWDKYTPEQIRDFAEIIYKGYKNAAQYIDNLLDFSNLSANRIELNFESIDFVELVKSCVRKFKELYLYDNETQINVFIVQEHLPLRCDVKQIEKVIIYLLENALQYGGQSAIEISVNQIDLSKGEKGVQFSICDFGIGIPKNELAHIFGPFVQSSKTKKPSGGRGFGLAIAQKIVSMHKGKIWAENNVGHSGATFFFIIPLV